MNSEFIKNIVEAALMVAEKPLAVEQLQGLFDPAEQEDLSEAVVAALAQLQEDYSGRGVELRKVASGYRFQARAEFAPWVNRLWEERPARYSRAFMETLAIIAYRQPITRGEIEEIRGVAVSSSIIKTLMEREWLRIAGHRDVPGRPAVYVTTPQFLDYFNLASLTDLPALSEPGAVEGMAAGLEESEGLLPESSPDAASYDDVSVSPGLPTEVCIEETDAAMVADHECLPEPVPTALTDLSVADLGDLSDEEVASQLAQIEAAVDTLPADDEAEVPIPTAQSNWRRAN